MLEESKDPINFVLRLLSEYSHWIIFLGLLLENTLFIGFLVPGVTVILMAGFLAGSGEIHFWPAIVLGTAGTILGDNLNYAIGRYGATRLSLVNRVLEIYPAVNLFFQRGSAKVYVFFHFPGYLRTFFPLLLGACRFSFHRWLWIDFVGATLFNLAFMLVGYYAARVTREIATATQVGNYIIAFFMLLSFIWLVVLCNKVRKYLKRKKDPSNQIRSLSTIE